MPSFLVLKLDGPMQAWGTHTFEDFRPSNRFPTRSALLGLLAGCLGIERSDAVRLDQLARSIEFAIRADARAARPERDASDKHAIKLPDFHTVLNARGVDRKPGNFPVVSRREYLFDAAFTVAIGVRTEASMTLEAIARAVRQPRYTPVLGRRSCPLARPLFDAWVEAESLVDALDRSLPNEGVIYAEGESSINERLFLLRDVPLGRSHRQFGTRHVYVHRRERQD